MSALRILIIEDEAIVAMLVEYSLLEMGYAVCASETTEDQAVAAAIRCTPDVLVVDVGLVEGNGISAVRRILCGGFIPHVFMSGQRLDERTLHPGAIVLQKPFRSTDLAKAMVRAVSIGRLWLTAGTAKAAAPS